jgi:biotin operon repressor
MTSSATHMDNIQTDRYMSEPDLAKHLSCSPSTVRRLRKKGLPCVGKDRLRRYHLGTVLKWLNERK